jgi:NAD+ synthase (glutamine-hydrolysing)
MRNVQAGDKRVEADARRIGQYAQAEQADSAPELAHRLLTTVYMGTVNSSKDTQQRAAALAQQVSHFPALKYCLQQRFLGDSKMVSV